MATSAHKHIQPHLVNQYVSSNKSDFLDLLWGSNLLTDPKNLDITRLQATGQMETLENWSGYLDK